LRARAHRFFPPFFALDFFVVFFFAALFGGTRQWWQNV